MSEKRIIVRIELTPDAKQRLVDLTDKAGMTQVAVASRVLEWAANQDEMIQAEILGHYPADIKGDVAKAILKRMAAKTSS